MSTTDKFRVNMEHALDEHFPKRKCKERSSALMVFATSILEHERVMCLVRKHFGQLLDRPEKGSHEHESALDFYKQLTK